MDSFPVCTQCGFTFGEYRARGLLGCPHCYASFGDALQADVAWMHHALAFINPETPASPAPASSAPAAPAVDPETMATWRERIAEAVRTENYEEAARLNRLIRGIAQSDGPFSGGQRPDLGLV